jgi:DNA primase
MKDDRLLEELKARLDIVDVVSEYVEIKRAGQNYKGLCPFHSEKTPSFMISPDKQIFHCFGCGAGGDVIHFVMKYENLSFHESLKLLAKKAGISLKEYKALDADDRLREKLVEILKAASEFFTENLRRSKTASEYLTDRGLAGETVRSFSLGYALKDWHNLSHYLKAKGFPPSLVVQSGVVSSGDKGIYDIFRGRIMFPIRDIQGEVIAFGGRVMDDAQPKYLNSPDSPLFKKGETLYGLDYAKEDIRKKGYALITEGYFDVLLCHQNGFRNSVAPLGTALTAGHLQKLKRFTRKVVVVFDGDEAGKSAARRAIPLLLEQSFVPKILLLPERDDPDSFLRRKGDSEFDALVSKARTPVDFILNASGKDRVETVREAVEVMSHCGDMIMKEELARELSEKSGMRESVIREEMKRTDMRRKERHGVKPSPASAPAFCYDAELLLLSALLAFPDRLNDVLQVVQSGEFRNPTVKGILEKLGTAKDGDGVGNVLASLSGEERELVTRLTFQPGFEREDLDRNIEDCLARIRSRKIRAQQELIHEKIKLAENAGQHESLASLIKERQKLMREAK